jgi:aminopeptidase N
VDATYSAGSTRVKSLLGLACPDFVFPNLDNHDYALYSFDDRSLKLAGDVLRGSLADGPTRLMTWQILEQMVRDAKLPVHAYLDLALAGLEAESDEALLAVLLGRYSPIRTITNNYLTIAERKAFLPKIESLIWKRLEQQPGGSNLQMTFWSFYNQTAATADSLKRRHDILEGRGIPSGLDMDQDRRWSVLIKLAEQNYPGVAAMIDKMESEDPSTSGKRDAATARVALPSKEAKAKFWTALEKPEQIQKHLRLHRLISEPLLRSRMQRENFSSISSKESVKMV